MAMTEYGREIPLVYNTLAEPGSVKWCTGLRDNLSDETQAPVARARHPVKEWLLFDAPWIALFRWLAKPHAALHARQLAYISRER